MSGSAGGSGRGLSAPTILPFGGSGSGGSAGGPPGLGAGQPSTREIPGKDDRRRFEFVVMLVWREPVPKIEPNPEAGGAAAPSTGTTGGF
jgi:hypothetical protein